MARDDMELNRQLNRILVKQDVDTRKIKYRVTGSRVRFKGKLVRRHGEEFEDKGEVQDLEKRLKRIHELHNIVWDLENWHKDNGRWEKASKSEESVQREETRERHRGGEGEGTRWEGGSGGVNE